MKRYLLFAGESYEANGGAEDLIGNYATPLECKEAIDKLNGKISQYKSLDWYHVLDFLTGEVFESIEVLVSAHIHIDTPKGKMWFDQRVYQEMMEWERKNLNQ